MANNATIKKWMKEHVEEFVDKQTDEVNITALGESACAEFSGWSNDNDIPDNFFELAWEISDERSRE